MRAKPTLVLHFLLYLPYDLVSVLAGLLKIDWKAFLTGPILGSLPGTMALILVGSSIQGGAIYALPHINLPILAAGGVLFAGSVALARYLKTSQQFPIQNQTAQLAY